MPRFSLEWFHAAVDVAEIRSSPGGDKLSPETVLILAYFMGDKSVTGIEKATRCGTLNKPDRSSQYDSPEYLAPEKLRHAINALGTHVRTSQANQDRMQRQLMNLKLRNAVVVAAITAMIARAPEIVALVERLLR